MIKAGAGVARSSVVMGREEEPTIFSFSSSDHNPVKLRNTNVPSHDVGNEIPAAYLRSEHLPLPNVSERDVTAHFTRLTHRQYAVDLGAYPLGSCTMKYNPKMCDAVSALARFEGAHPNTPTEFVQAWLQVLYELEQALCEVAGMSGVTLQPAAGAAGELTGLLMMQAYHEAQSNPRKTIIIPDSAHGTNPASVTLGGYQTITVPTNDHGLVDVEALKKVVDEDVAGMMLTNPNTLGLFEQEIAKIAEIIHDAGAIMYYDGANLNAILGKCRPGDMGFDIVHMNLHKTFAVPHGGGGPGAGPVGVTEKLVDFLPGPRPIKIDDHYDWMTPSKSIGRVHGWHGNSLALLRAYSYILLNGSDGLRDVSERAVLNANYLRTKLRDSYDIPFDTTCMHEFVVSASSIKKETGVKAFDIAKALLDHGFHAPTMYFPLIVEEALMIEPTETESLETLDELAVALNAIATEASTPEGAESIRTAPHLTPVGRVDEAQAARALILTDDHPST